MSTSGKVHGKRSNLKRSLSLFDDYPRQKPFRRAKTEPGMDNNHLDDQPGLEDIGIVRSLGSNNSLARALSTSRYVHENMFDIMPERASGMNSTRIAEVLNFRKNLPALLSTAHVHALSPSPSASERQIASLIGSCSLRRINVPGRGQGISNVSDLLISMEDLASLLRRSRVKPSTRESYLDWLKANPFANILYSNDLSAEQTIELLKAGFITSDTANSTTAPTISTAAALGTATSLGTIASAAAGTEQAAGGPGATFGAGGGGAGVLQRGAGNSGTNYQTAIPNAGAYLKLLVAARTHLVELLKKSSRRELPLYLLREYWDAGLSSKQAMASAGKVPFGSLLPGQTRKWKSFYGMKFDFILAEAFGAGLVECFNTRAVGLGVRVAWT